MPRNVQFKDDLIQLFEQLGLSPQYSFSEFCQMSVREELTRRKNGKSAAAGGTA
jgi:hypothetical protein